MGVGKACLWDQGRDRLLASGNGAGTSLARTLGWKSLARGHGVGTTLVMVQELGHTWLGDTGIGKPGKGRGAGTSLARGQDMGQAWLGDYI